MTEVNISTRVADLEASIAETKAVAVAALAALSHLASNDDRTRSALGQFVSEELDGSLGSMRLTEGQQELVRQLLEHFAKLD